MTTKKLNRRPLRALRTGGVLLPLTCMLGMGHAVFAASTSPTSTTSTTTDPDAPLRPKLSPAELDQLELTLGTQAQQVTQELNDARTRLGLGADDELKLTQAQIDPYGTAHFRFHQYHQGLRVLGVGLIAHRDGASATNTPYLAPGLSMDITPAVPEAQARTIAEQAFGAASGTPLTTLLELAIQPIEVIRFEPDSTGGINNSDQMFRDVVGYRLVYVAQVALEEPDAPEAPPEAAPTGEAPTPAPSRAADSYSLDDTEPQGDSSPVASESAALAQEPLRILIDAATGRIVAQRRDLSNAGQPVTSLGHSQFHGDVELSTNYDSGLVRYQLYDPYRGINSVRDLKNGTSGKTKNSYLYWSPDNEFGDGLEFVDGDNTSSARGETAAVDVAYGLERSWDMLRKVFGRKGLNGKNAPVNARVHYGHNYNDAHWSNYWKQPFFGDGTDGTDPDTKDTPPLTNLGIVGHELGHGLWQYELGPSNKTLASGINEGHGDVMGSLVEFYTYGDQGLGSHIPDTHAGWNWMRRMVNPEGYHEKDSQGNERNGLRYFNSNIANEPVHVIGTLYGHAFVFLAHGSVSNPNSTLYSAYLPNGMAGIGADRAGELWYLATTAYLPDEPDFNQLRAAYLAAAKQIYGEGSRVHNAVKDAFGAVGVGPLAVDSTAPEILDTHLAEVDEGDGTVFVVASVNDDTGVIRTEFKVASLQRDSGFYPYAAYLDISSLVLGPHPVSVTAVDRTLKTANATLPLTLVGANQLLTNGTFEAGTTGWSASSGVIGKSASGRPQPFLGSWNAAFSASDSLIQNVTIPADATSAPLSFRVRVERDTTDAGVLSVSVKDLNTGVVTPLASYARDDVKYFPAGRHYRRGQFDLASFRGHSVQLRFVSNAATGDGDFGIDNVSVTYTAPITVSPPSLVLHEDEQTLRFEFGGISGYAPERIHRVEYVVGGVVKGGTIGSPVPVLVSIKDWPAGNTSVVARVYDNAGALVGQSASVPLTLKGAKHALSNGDFELGTTSWTLSGSVGVGLDGEGVYRAFLGQRYARLGGQGVQHDSSVSQIIGLPDNILNAHLSYRLAIETDEDNAGGTDMLQIEVQVLPAGTWEVLEVVTANTNISGGETYRGYQRRTVDLTAYHGKTVRLRFRVRENTGLQTLFRVDNASVTYTPFVISI